MFLSSRPVQRRPIFTPVSYKLKLNAREMHGEKYRIAYLLTVRGWVLGEVVSSGRHRLSLTQLLRVIVNNRGNALGFAKLARDGGLANNTVAGGYIEQLSDLLSVMPSGLIDTNKRTALMRKPCKFHFINLAVASAFHLTCREFLWNGW